MGSGSQTRASAADSPVLGPLAGPAVPLVVLQTRWIGTPVTLVNKGTDSACAVQHYSPSRVFVLWMTETTPVVIA